MRNQSKFYLLLILVLIPIQIIISQDNKTKVLVEVTLNQKTPDEAGTRLTNFIKGDLIKSYNVELVNENEDYKINVMMFENRTKEGNTLGYVFSAIFLAPSDCKGNKAYKYLTSTLLAARESEFDKTAESIVKYFDEAVLSKI